MTSQNTTNVINGHGINEKPENSSTNQFGYVNGPFRAMSGIPVGRQQAQQMPINPPIQITRKNCNYTDEQIAKQEEEKALRKSMRQSSRVFGQHSAQNMPMHQFGAMSSIPVGQHPAQQMPIHQFGYANTHSGMTFNVPKAPESSIEKLTRELNEMASEIEDANTQIQEEISKINVNLPKSKIRRCASTVNKMVSDIEEIAQEMRDKLNKLMNEVNNSS
jgi:phenylalanyl-tRNA synthetase alpha subunit